MIPCPDCKNLCGIREAMLVHDRLYYRCVRCVSSFDAAAALRRSHDDPAMRTLVEMKREVLRLGRSDKPTRRVARYTPPERTPVVPSSARKYHPVFARKEPPALREATPSLAQLIAMTRTPLPPPELTPTVPMLPPPSSHAPIVDVTDDDDVTILDPSDATPLRPASATTSRPVPFGAVTPAPAAAPRSSERRASSLPAVLGGVVAVMLFVAAIAAGVAANEPDPPRSKGTPAVSSASDVPAAKAASSSLLATSPAAPAENAAPHAAFVVKAGAPPRRALAPATSPPRTLAEAFADKADAMLRAGDPVEAKRLYERALAESPTFVPARLGVAEAEWRLGRLDEARERYRALLADAPHLAPTVAYERASSEGRP
ncbi:MAG: tetratricopeptide repeat protein [Labilithrix sp.]|nr:tetratricopeptide repeat protein [Labilithrix sp.]MCW5812836.1 tetratricopeptide repeat protein [Labilithrix sp.]